MRCRTQFLAYSEQGYRDAASLGTERARKSKVLARFRELLGPGELRSFVRTGKHREVMRIAVTVERPMHCR